MIDLHNTYVSTDELKKMNREKLLETLTQVTSELAFLLMCQKTSEVVSTTVSTGWGKDKEVLPAGWYETTKVTCEGLLDLCKILERQIRPTENNNG